ncbi:MAG: GNAT family N-acetyltransferase [Leisingera sp.]
MNDRAASRGTPDPALQVRVLTSWAAMTALEADWREMHVRCRGRLYSSFDWLAAQHAAFAAPGRLRIITVWHDTEMVAAAPMCLARRQVSKLLPFHRPRVLTSWVCSYTGFFEFLATSRTTLRALLKAVAAAASPAGVELEPFRVCTRDAYITRGLRLEGFRLWQDRIQGCAFAENLTCWDSYYETRSRSFRKKVRQGSNRLQQAGVALAAFDSPAQQEAPGRMLALSRRSWKQRTGTGLAVLPGAEVFLGELWARFAAAGDASIVLLTFGKQDIASCCALRLGGTWYCLFSDFDEEFAELSPGRMMVCRALQVLIGMGAQERIEFMRWTHFLKDFATSAYQVRRLRATPRGSFAYWLLKAENTLRKMAGGGALPGRRKLRRSDVLEAGGGGA